jgi:hypothetical protein
MRLNVDSPVKASSSSQHRKDLCLDEFGSVGVVTAWWEGLRSGAMMETGRWQANLKEQVDGAVHREEVCHLLLMHNYYSSSFRALFFEKGTVFRTSNERFSIQCFDETFKNYLVKY